MKIMVADYVKIKEDSIDYSNIIFQVVLHSKGLHPFHCRSDPLSRASATVQRSGRRRDHQQRVSERQPEDPEHPPTQGSAAGQLRAENQQGQKEQGLPGQDGGLLQVQHHLQVGGLRGVP